MINKIKDIKSQLGDDLLILAHHYQSDDIVALADAVGDSLKLAQIAEQNKTAKYIVFCGVHFMAETADILTADEQIVLMPDDKAGCPMADMANSEQIEKAWIKLTEEFGNSIVPITYINSKAVVKAFCGRHGGTTVTSGNASKVVKWGMEKANKILFLPDQNLGRNTAAELGVPLEAMAEYDPVTEEISYTGNPEDIKIILWAGYCHVHHKISTDNVKAIRDNYPDMKIIIHPECQYEVAQASDFNGSTEYIINTVKNSPSDSQWAIGTESNLVNRVKADNPDKTVIILDTQSHCSDMNLTNPETLLATLEDILAKDYKRQIKVDKTIAKDAVVALNTMLSLS